MAIRIARLPVGTRVRIKQAAVPQDPAVLGRSGTVIVANEYRAQMLGIVLDGEDLPRYFAPAELEVTEEPAIPPEREAAKARRALP